MILVDTSVWINYFRGKQNTQPLTRLLNQRQIICHPWILGELSLGNLGLKRAQILADLKVLPMLPVLDSEQLCIFIEEEFLYSTGLSWVDLQILFSSILSDCFLWTHDRCLSAITEKLGKIYNHC